MSSTLKAKFETDLTRLACILGGSHAPVFDLSEDFVTCDNIDDDCFSPLDHVTFNPKTKRYHTPNCASLKEDDWILQAMVVSHLYRLEHGVGKEKMLRHLSIWEGTKKPKVTKLPNLWADEVAELKCIPQKEGSKNMKLMCGLKHQDEFDAFCSFYWSNVFLPKDGQPTAWCRRCEGTSQRHYVHIFAEQATVQWAVEEAQPELWELAANVIRFQRNATQREHRRALPRLLREQAGRDNDERSFAQRVARAMERQQTQEGADGGVPPPQQTKRRRVSDD